jgi:hypothetical protein
VWGESDGRPRSLVKYERDHHVDLIFRDLPVVASYLLLLDPGAPDVAKRLTGPRETSLNRVFETLRRGRADL